MTSVISIVFEQIVHMCVYVHCMCACVCVHVCV